MIGKKMSQKWRWTSMLLLLYSPFSFSEEFHLKFLPSPTKKINGIFWNQDEETQEPVIQVREVDQEGSPYFVRLRGKATTQNQELLFKAEKLPLKDDGSFDLEVEIEGSETEFTFNAILLSGKLETESEKLLFPEWEDFKKSVTYEKKNLTFQAGLSVSGTTYSQVDSSSGTINSFSQLGFNLEGQCHYELNKFLAFRTQALVTALPIGLGGSGNTIRSLNLNAQAIYTPKFIRSPWKLEILGNYSYRTTFPSSTSFGYFNTHGITLYPRVERMFSASKKAFLELKYLPFLNGNSSFGFLPLGNYELSFKAGYQGFKIKSHAIEITFESSFFALTYAGGSNGSIRANSYTIGANYLF
jgi:hypothetical protein